MTQDDDTVTLANGLQTMGNGDTCTLHLCQMVGHAALRHIVKCRRSLIKEHDVRTLYQGTGQEDALSLTSRNAPSIFRNKSLKSVRHPLDVFVESDQTDSLHRIRLSSGRSREENIVEQRTFYQPAILKDGSNAIAPQT